MNKTLPAAALMLTLAIGAGCTNMSNTGQGATTGALIGAAGGAGIAALTHSHPGWGALAGAGAGALAGGLIGAQQDQDDRGYDRDHRRYERDDRRYDRDHRPPPPERHNDSY